MKRKSILVGMLVIVLAATSLAPSFASPITKVNQTIEAYPLHEVVSRGAANLGNVLISADSPEDDLHPKIAVNSEGTFVVTYEHSISLTQGVIDVCYSNDGGNTWVKQFEFDSAAGGGSGLFLNPYIIFNPVAGYFFITMSDPYGSMNVGYWVQSDIAAATEPAIGVRTADDMSYYTASTYVGEWMVWLRLADDSAGEQNPELIYLMYDEEEDTFKLPSDVGYGAFGSYYDAHMILQTSPSKDPAMATGAERMYMVMEHYNETTGHTEIAYKSTVTDLDPNSDTFLFQGGGGPGGMDKYADVEVWGGGQPGWQRYFGKSDMFDATNPDVDASGNNVVIVYATNNNTFGDWDIRCDYSHDNGETWGTSVVTGDHPSDEKYPAVFVSGDTVYVIYVKDGNLYLVKSTDGGETWGEPEQVNEVDGTVAEEENTADICGGGIVWTDTRNGDKDIYFSPLPTPIISISGVSGGVGITATVSNVGTADAENIPWSIDVTGGLVILGQHAEGTIPSLAPGESVSISSGLVLGIGKITVTITAGGTTKTASGFLLGPLILGLK